MKRTFGLKVKQHKMRSVVFRLDDSFNPGDPDFNYVHQTVAKALAPHRAHPHRPPAEQDDQDACAYHPVG